MSTVKFLTNQECLFLVFANLNFTHMKVKV